MKFTKMHGIGNDYIYVNCLEETVSDPAALAIAMSRYHFGVGSDGLVLIDRDDQADFSMRMYNSDGSMGAMCGNATRCIGKYVYERGLTDKTTFTLMTGSGIKTLHLTVEDGKVVSVRVDMGEPVFAPEKIPVALPGDRVMDHPMQVNGREYRLHCVSMGNPHCVIFGEDPRELPLEKIGPVFERLSIFPDRVNTEFVQVIDREHLRMRVWERGSGETLACGTGACATLVAAAATGRAAREADVELLGGTLHIRWDERDNHVYMEGPASFVFDGVWLGDEA